MNFGLYQFSTLRVEQKYRMSWITAKTNDFFFFLRLLQSKVSMVIYWPVSNDSSFIAKSLKGRIFPQWFMWWLSHTTVPFRPNFFFRNVADKFTNADFHTLGNLFGYLEPRQFKHQVCLSCLKLSILENSVKEKMMSWTGTFAAYLITLNCIAFWWSMVHETFRETKWHWHFDDGVFKI